MRQTAKTAAPVESILSRMSIDDKIGQCLTFEFVGTRITAGLRDKILKLRCGGLRVTPHVHEALPYGVRRGKAGDVQRRAPWAGPEQYAELINEVQAMAMSRDPAIPLHVSIDFEGDLSAQLGKGGAHLLPSAMGMRATGDLSLAREGWRVLARQLRAAGINMLHSPNVDIDALPNNAAIGPRAFADTPRECARWGVAMAETLVAEGIIATAKHFPGLGFTRVDTHFDIDTDTRSLDEMMANELYPYRQLIRAGVPAIMPSHTAYPALDPAGRPATISRPIIEFTRKVLRFHGVLATDSMGMAGVVKMCGDSIPLAAKAALAAGSDLILVKTVEEMEAETVSVIRQAVEAGEITEADLDAHVRRILANQA